MPRIFPKPDTRLPWLQTLASLAATLLLAVMLLLAAACGTDEDTVEGKRCEYGSDDPDLQCVEGYRCVPGPDGAFCEKVN